MTKANVYYKKEDEIFTIEKKLSIQKEELQKIFNKITKKYKIKTKAKLQYPLQQRDGCRCQTIIEYNPITKKRRIKQYNIILDVADYSNLLLLIHEISHALNHKKSFNQYKKSYKRKKHHTKELMNITKDIIEYCRKQSFYKKLVEEHKREERRIKRIKWTKFTDNKTKGE